MDTDKGREPGFFKKTSFLILGLKKKNIIFNFRQHVPMSENNRMQICIKICELADLNVLFEIGLGLIQGDCRGLLELCTLPSAILVFWHLTIIADVWSKMLPVCITQVSCVNARLLLSYKTKIQMRIFHMVEDLLTYGIRHSASSLKRLMWQLQVFILSVLNSAYLNIEYRQWANLQYCDLAPAVWNDCLACPLVWD